ncbi:[NiFe]-hydrogenase assembly chaperone HybE [Shewanella sp. GXUN23E]|uniref:[NiFe]-hydrogenase assembly chaperone HybE n=1 Tax=Shewanella sp. GXUN23E TaxID=3422498 RepID=UPI003D7DABAB
MTDTDDAIAVARVLEQVFIQILNTRMLDMPVINPGLQVQALGFRRYGDCWLGALITPWFINLVLLPTHQDWSCLGILSKHRHEFPSGRYEFVLGHEPQLGFFQSCSLFSPVFEFACQTGALDAAAAALSAMTSPPAVHAEEDSPQDWPAQMPVEAIDSPGNGCLPANRDCLTPAMADVGDIDACANDAGADNAVSELPADAQRAAFIRGRFGRRLAE